tara:strand:- start:201 stop:1784 length:1584 start_codon:yes stop_codon:yes gene_type:complete
MSYRNPVTYVDSQSGKYFASAIQNISNTTAGVINKLGIKAEEERKNKEAENLKLLNDTTKYNLDYLNSANLASKDFDLQPSLQPALSGLVDEAAKIKAQLFNSKSPAERSQLQSQLTQYENFFKGGGMKNLLETFQEKREAYSKLGTVGKAGNEGGVDLQKLDPQLSKFFLSTYNDRLPSDLGINIVNNNSVFDIVLNSSGGQFGENGSYQQSLMGLMSAEIPTIPNITSESNQALYEDNLIDSKTKYVTDKGMATYLRGSGRKNVGSNTFEFYEFDDQGKKLFRENMGRNVLATLAGYSNEGTLMDGPGTGFNSIESYYNNVLRQSGDPDLEIGNEKGTSLTPESLELVTKHMVDNLEKEFEKGINPIVLKKEPSQTSKNASGSDDPIVVAKYNVDSVIDVIQKQDPRFFVGKKIAGKTVSDATIDSKTGKIQLYYDKPITVRGKTEIDQVPIPGYDDVNFNNRNSFSNLMEQIISRGGDPTKDEIKAINEVNRYLKTIKFPGEQYEGMGVRTDVDTRPILFDGTN